MYNELSQQINNYPDNLLVLLLNDDNCLSANDRCRSGAIRNNSHIQYHFAHIKYIRNSNLHATGEYRLRYASRIVFPCPGSGRLLCRRVRLKSGDAC